MRYYRLLSILAIISSVSSWLISFSGLRYLASTDISLQRQKYPSPSHSRIFVSTDGDISSNAASPASAIGVSKSAPFVSAAPVNLNPRGKVYKAQGRSTKEIAPINENIKVDRVRLIGMFQLASSGWIMSCDLSVLSLQLRTRRPIAISCWAL